jgi:hypothetical protein
MAERFLAARFNRPGYEIVDHHTYAIVSDGDLMEGVVSEAASLAGHLKLGKLIYLYDNNHITLAGETGLNFTEECANVLRPMAGMSSRSKRVTTLRLFQGPSPLPRTKLPAPPSYQSGRISVMAALISRILLKLMVLLLARRR